MFKFYLLQNEASKEEILFFATFSNFSSSLVYRICLVRN